MDLWDLTNKVRPNALVVDDEELMLELISHMLRRELDMRVMTDTKCISALKRLKKNPNEFQIIISDWEMPGVKGIDFLRAVREINADIPFLMVSGYASKEHIMQAKQFGISGYIVKPFSKQNLIAKVKQLL